MTQSYEKHLIAFIDLLGFSEASYNDESTKTAILNLLTSLAQSRSDFDIKIEPKENGTVLQIKAGISTFSDHVIITYPIEALKNHNLDFGMVLHFLQKIIAKIASQAFLSGFLLRGGITIGPLYHSQGVVFGEALIDAYNLETKTAVYPRIIISPKILAHPLYKMTETIFLIKDFDGLTYLNYLRIGILECATPGDNFPNDFKNWVGSVSAIIQDNIKKFTQSEDLRKLAKWTWFHEYFGKCISLEPASAFLK